MHFDETVVNLTSIETSDISFIKIFFQGECFTRQRDYYGRNSNQQEDDVFAFHFAETEENSYFLNNRACKKNTLIN